MKRFWLIPMSILFVASFAEDDPDNLMQMSLEALLDMEITTASKKAQSLSEAPAVVSVFTKEQLARLELRKLSDFLAYVPGLATLDTYWKPDIAVVRGVRPTVYNDKVLMLINGVPDYDAASMEFFLDSIPIIAVERIEVIRGPGSTLYGTNAFAGVINIITRQDDEKSFYATAGSFKAQEVGGYISGKAGALNATLAVEMRNDEGYRKSDVIDESGALGSITYERDIENVFLDLAYRQTRVSFGHSFQHFGKFGPAPRHAWGENGDSAGGKASHRKFFANFQYEHAIGKLQSKWVLHYDDTDKQTATGAFGAVYVALGAIEPEQEPETAYYRFGGETLQAEWQGQYTWKSLNFTGGLVTERRKVVNLGDMADGLNGNLIARGSTEELPFTISDSGAYLQLDGKTGKLGYVAGVRVTRLGIDEETYSTPRGGLVYNFGFNAVKLLYGEAFRSPGPHEQYYRVPALIYGPDLFGRSLKPERIRTAELAWDAKIGERLKLRVNAFDTEILDLIGRRDSTAEERDILGNNAKVYDNLGTQETQGLELELQGYPAAAGFDSYFVNLSYTQGEENDGSDIAFLADLLASAGFHFRTSSFSKLSVFGRYVGEREGHMTDGTFVSVDDYALMDLTFSYFVGDSITLSLGAHNVFDKIYTYPEFVRRRMETIPGGPGRTIQVTGTYRF
ncbi:TonB-dependent receptor [Sulfidibacter corallicola]|uniref:TonB-dependent receptor n=1 Tax=Sulfidibacter corallicola TaxID=2818388 RepID=A0A8A4TJY7_SULCO|nr:TonB-dependent receptor [Sulfidibacter corallicola]QTD49797.1 TonB-dependent receptor [Sulfidibacter corallicola]